MNKARRYEAAMLLCCVPAMLFLVWRSGGSLRSPTAPTLKDSAGHRKLTSRPFPSTMLTWTAQIVTASISLPAADRDGTQQVRLVILHNHTGFTMQILVWVTGPLQCFKDRHVRHMKKMACVAPVGLCRAPPPLCWCLWCRGGGAWCMGAAGLVPIPLSQHLPHRTARPRSRLCPCGPVSLWGLWWRVVTCGPICWHTCSPSKTHAPPLPSTHTQTRPRPTRSPPSPSPPLRRLPPLAPSLCLPPLPVPPLRIGLRRIPLRRP
jgi:hypothetical protein